MGEEKEYYRFIDIAVALREYLKEGYNILNEMLSLIDIKSDVKYKVSIKLSQQRAFNLLEKQIKYKDKPYSALILLFVSKSGFSPLRMIRNHRTLFEEDTNPLYSIDNADFIIERKDGKVVINNRYKYDIPRTYRPQLTILDDEKMNALYQRLENEGYIGFPAITYFYNGYPEWHFNLSFQNLHLEEVESYNRYLVIDYDPSTDTLTVRDNRKNSKCSAKESLNREIPKEVIYKGYRDIIDKYLASKKDVEVSSELKDVKGNVQKVFKKTK